MRSLGSLHAGAGRYGVHAQFNPLVLPDSSITWEGLWDLSRSTVTLDGGNVAEVSNLGTDGATGKMEQTTSANRPLYVADWRNGQPAFTPGGGDLLRASIVDPSQPLTALFAGDIPNTSAGEDFRILLSGTGAPANSSLLYLQRVSGSVFALRTNCGSTAQHVADVTAWWGKPFVAIVSCNGASSRLDIWLHGVAKQAFTGWNPGTGSAWLLRWGSGGAGSASGFWDASQMATGLTSGTLSATDRTYLLQGYSDQIGIVTA